MDKWLEAGLNLLFPPHCAACGRRGAWLCDACIEAIIRFAPPLCPQCGQPRRAATLCPVCRRHPSLLAGIRSLGPFMRPLQQAIHALKYEGLRALAPLLADLLAEYWRCQPLPVDALVPVPLHRARERRRGYNQAVLLARELSKRVNIPVLAEAVVRRRDTPPQVGLSREARYENMKEAFAVGRVSPVGRHVLLLDDVLTTGATLEACAAPLLAAGARNVWALTLARATLEERVSPVANPKTA